MFLYRSVYEYGEAEYIIEKSRFIAHVSPAETPEATILPETMMPDPADGEVRDSDGIITDGDNGNENVEAPTAPDSTIKPEVGGGKLTTGMKATGKSTGAKQ